MFDGMKNFFKNMFNDTYSNNNENFSAEEEQELNNLLDSDDSEEIISKAAP